MWSPSIEGPNAARGACGRTLFVSGSTWEPHEQVGSLTPSLSRCAGYSLAAQVEQVGSQYKLAQRTAAEIVGTPEESLCRALPELCCMRLCSCCRPFQAHSATCVRAVHCRRGASPGCSRVTHRSQTSWYCLHGDLDYNLHQL